MEMNNAILNDSQQHLKYFIKKFDSIKKNSEEDRAYGAIIGAFIADSCGSYYEFSKKKLSDNEMAECMRMPGGGPHKVAPGQPTDDSELSMCLLNSIVESNLNS